jgi:(hydroxyamino)benzene mutase
VADLLIALGVALFFGGLLSGFIIPKLKIPRMGLTSHLEGTANGTFLIVVGLIWDRLHLGDLWLVVAFWTLVYGTWANWFATLLAGFWGTGNVTPIAGGGVTGKRVHESIVTAMLIGVAIADVVGVGILFVGLVR